MAGTIEAARFNEAGRGAGGLQIRLLCRHHQLAEIEGVLGTVAIVTRQGFERNKMVQASDGNDHSGEDLDQLRIGADLAATRRLAAEAFPNAS